MRWMSSLFRNGDFTSEPKHGNCTCSKQEFHWFVSRCIASGNSLASPAKQDVTKRSSCTLLMRLSGSVNPSVTEEHPLVAAPRLKLSPRTRLALLFLLSLAVAEPGDAERIVVLEFRWKHGLREVLEADGAGEAIDCKAADRWEARVGGGWIRTAVNHGVGDFDAGGESVEDEAAGFLFEDVDEFAIGGEIVFVSENGRRQVAVESVCGAQVVFCGIAVYEQSVGPEYLVGELGLGYELIEAYGEELGLCMEWRSALLYFGVVLRICGHGNLSGAGLRCPAVFACYAFGEKRERLGLFDEGFEFVEERSAFRRFRGKDYAGLGAELAGSPCEWAEEALG